MATLYVPANRPCVFSPFHKSQLLTRHRLAVTKGDQRIPYVHEHKYQRGIRRAAIYKSADPSKKGLTHKKKASFYRLVDREIGVETPPKRTQVTITQPESVESALVVVKKRRVTADRQIVATKEVHAALGRTRRTPIVHPSVPHS